MNAFDGLNCLKFNNEPIFYQNIYAVPAVKSDSLVLNRQRMLQIKGDSISMKFLGKALLIC